VSSRPHEGAEASRSVRQDWFAGLPEERHRAFDAAVGGLESLYAMVSVALDEAFSAREKGALVLAREQVAISAELTNRLGIQLFEALRALEEYGRKARKYPQVAPLNADFFRGATAQRIAAMQEVMHRLMPTRRARFTHKVEALGQTVQELTKEYRAAAEEIAAGASTDPAGHWEALDLVHYDLNTCLRETIVILKSFLLALSSGQFEAFQERLTALVPHGFDPGVSGAST
jgi:hypothetical protein